MKSKVKLENQIYDLVYGKVRSDVCYNVECAVDKVVSERLFIDTNNSLESILMHTVQNRVFRVAYDDINHEVTNQL